MAVPTPSECVPLARDRQFVCVKHGRLLLDCEMDRLKESQVLLIAERDRLASDNDTLSKTLDSLREARDQLAKALEETKVVRLGNEKMLMVNEKYLNKCWICGESADTCTKCASKAVEKAHTAAKGA